MKLFARLFLFQLVLLVLFVVAELVADWWIVNSADEADFTRYASAEQLDERYADDTTRRYKPHRYLGYVNMPGFTKESTSNNSLGFRGEDFPLAKPEGERRIVFLGGSTTYETEVFDDQYAAPAVVQRLLRTAGRPDVRVINAGCGGWASWESLINFELRVLPLDPDVIVIYHAINDVHARMVWPPAAYSADNAGRREPVTANVRLTPWWQSSALLRIVGVQAGWMRPHSFDDPMRQLFDGGTPYYYADIFRGQLKTGSYPSGIFKKVSAREMLAANPPVHFARNLESIIALARSRGIEVVLTTFAWSREFPDHPRSSSEEYAEALAEMNATIKRIADERNTHLFDFQAVFPDDRSLYADGRHVNAKGSLIKGRLFAEYLMKSGLAGTGD